MSIEDLNYNDGTDQSVQSSTSSTRSSVSFGSVQVREFARIVSPDVCMGLGIGWEYNQKPEQPVSAFAPQRHSSKPVACGLLSPAERLDLLNDYGFTVQELLRSDMARENRDFVRPGGSGVGKWFRGLFKKRRANRETRREE